MVGWQHQCSVHELGQTVGDGEGQGGLVCCGPWGHKKSDMTWRLNINTHTHTQYCRLSTLYTLKCSLSSC